MAPYLGQVSDRMLARHFRVKAETVARQRKLRGILACPRARHYAAASLMDYARRLEESLK